MRFYWTPERIRIIELYYATKGAAYCVEKLGPGCDAKKVFNKAAELGISSNKMQRKAPGKPGTNPELAKEMREQESVTDFLRRPWK